MKRMSFRERLATMTTEEILAGARAAAWGDRTHRAEQFSHFDDDRAETMAIALGYLDDPAMAEAEEELLRRHPELRREENTED